MSTLVERLEAAITDWDGSPMNDGEQPRDFLTCRTLREAAAALRATTGEGECAFDRDAVEWAYAKLRDFGCYSGSELGAHMGDRLFAMLQEAAAPPPPLRDAGAVAWRFRYADSKGWTYQEHRPADPATNPCGKVIEPLFAHPAPAQVDEALVQRLIDSLDDQHGGDHHDDDCPVCQAIAALAAAAKEVDR